MPKSATSAVPGPIVWETCSLSVCNMVHTVCSTVLDPRKQGAGRNRSSLLRDAAFDLLQAEDVLFKLAQPARR